jgi:hypothetical protein
MLLDAVEKTMRKEYTLEGVYQVRSLSHPAGAVSAIHA